MVHGAIEVVRALAVVGPVDSLSEVEHEVHVLKSVSSVDQTHIEQVLPATQVELLDDAEHDRVG